MNKQTQFKQAYPSAFFLDAENLDALGEYLNMVGFLHDHEKIISVEKPGEGNMNLVLRVITDKRTFIIKQARPWVEKYPQIVAPEERIIVELNYYRTTSANAAIANYHPIVLREEEPAFIMIIEDFGKALDFTYLYKKEQNLKEEQANQLVAYLSFLHNANFSKRIENEKMKLLNAEHIFDFPFKATNNFDLNNIQDGLASIATEYKNDKLLIEKSKRLKSIYLSNGITLLHGDFYPGSWQLTKDGIKVIDPEFCFSGCAEFDVGVFIGHLFLAQQTELSILNMLTRYKQPKNFDEKLALNFAGIEILRRILGLAQLPLELELNERKELMFIGKQLLLEPEMFTIWQQQ